MRTDICERGTDPDKVFVVPNAVDTERFTPRERNQDLAARLGLGGGPVVGYISNLGWREGIDVLLRGFAELRRHQPDAQCLVVGDGPERERLQALGDELGLGGSLVMPGHVPNQLIEDHYALFDLFVVPRVRDRASDLVTPLKPLEAMAMGLPLLVSDLPALREIAEPGERGQVFEPESADSLAEVAVEMLGSPGELRRLADAGLAWVRAQRTLDSNVGRYREALAGLI
jgi:glycosyltransferase involved in cell wall biosynthesis